MQFTLELQAISGFRENLPNVNFYTQSASLEMALFSVITSYCARCFFSMASFEIFHWFRIMIVQKKKLILIYLLFAKNTSMLLARCFLCKKNTKKIAFHGNPSQDRKAGCELWAIKSLRQTSSSTPALNFNTVLFFLFVFSHCTDFWHSFSSLLFTVLLLSPYRPFPPPPHNQQQPSSPKLPAIKVLFQVQITPPAK